MFKTIHILLALLICSIAPASSNAAATRQDAVWNYYHFDGTAFSPGPATDGSPFIAVRENMRPVILTNTQSNIAPISLPRGSGVIAGICYVQSSGGKLAGSAGFKPYPRVPLIVSSGGKQLVTVQTDDNGYFLVELAAGTYSIGSAPFSAEIIVESGVTTLVPLRAGKRMVD